ncbi:MAG TPA: manganese efflux pump [Streptosporangiaceae bacterium]|nr:manganese efflux pump [Streptosporangiaceae bacterium]
MLALTLVALSVGLSNLPAAIGMGIGGVDRRTRLRVGITFGVFEAGMPVIGLLIGHGLASSIGRETKWLAAALLIGVGGYTIVRSVRGKPSADTDRVMGGMKDLVKLGVSALALSLDNLAAGFALGSYKVSVLAGVVIFGIVSVAISLAGLEFGARIGRRAGERGELIGGVIMAGVGAAVGFGVLG